MLRLVAVALVAMCVLLTIAFLAALRGIAELRLRLASGAAGGGVPMLIIGRKLPDSLLASLAELPGHGEASIVAFVSGTCSTCLELADDLDRATGPVAACVVGEPEEIEGVLATLPSDVPVISGTAAKRIRTDMKLAVFPTAVLQRDGFIVAIGEGSGADTAADLDALWRQDIQTSQEATA